MSTVLLPPGDNPIAVNKYIIVQWRIWGMEEETKEKERQRKWERGKSKNRKKIEQIYKKNMTKTKAYLFFKVFHSVFDENCILMEYANSGEGRRSSVGPNVWKMKNCIESSEKRTRHIEWKEWKLSGLVTSCVGTAFWKRPLNETYKGRAYEEEDLSSYWITLKKAEDTESWKKKH